MKRVVSLILTAAMLLTFVPTVFAQAEDVVLSETTSSSGRLDLFSEGIDLFAESSVVDSGYCGDPSTNRIYKSHSWSLDSNGVLTVEKTTSNANYKMADFASGAAPWYGYRDQIKTIVIGDRVRYIGDYAFYNLDELTLVSFPEGLKEIGDYAFYSCDGVEIIDIPAKVDTLGNYAFYKCTALQSVSIPSGIKSVGYYAFAYCSSLKAVELPKSLSAGQGRYMFYQCSKIETAIIPEGVTTIPYGAFYYCKGLKTVCMSATVETISRYAFNQTTGLKTVYYGGSSSEWSQIDKTSGNTKLTAKTVKLYYNTKGPTSGKCGDDAYWTYSGGVLTVTGTGKMANYTSVQQTPWYVYIPDIETVVISNGITSVGDYTFYGATNLTTLNFAKTVTTLGECAFYECTALTELKLPSNLTSITWGTFGYCDGLTEVYIPSKVYSVGAASFGYCSNLAKITLPEGLKNIGTAAFGYCTALTEITIPSKVPQLKDATFGGCTNLKYVTLNNTMTSIGQGVFYQCFALDKLIVPDNITEIGQQAFPALNGEDANDAPITLYVGVDSYAEEYAIENDINFAYLEGEKITVEVLDIAGNPVESGYTIRWYHKGSQTSIGTGTTLENADLMAQYECTLTLTGDNKLKYYPVTGRISVTNVGATIILTEIAEIPLTGRVVDENGNGISDALVTLKSNMNGAVETLELYTDENGNYSENILAVPTTATVFCDGYYQKEVILISNDERPQSLKAADITLVKLPNDRITLVMDMEYAAEEGEESVVVPLTSAANIEFYLYNETKDIDIEDYKVEFPYIILGEGMAEAGDNLIIAAKDKNKTMDTEPAPVIIEEDGTGEAMFIFIQNGAVKANLISKRPKVAMVFDAEGNLVEKKVVTGIEYVSKNLPSGEYEIVFMENSPFLKHTATFDQFESLGYMMDEEYVMMPVMIENGIITNLGEIYLPELVIDEDLLDTDLSSLTVDKLSAPLGQLVKVYAQYAVKSGLLTSNQTVEINLPEGLELVEGSVTANGKTTSYSVEDNTISVTTNLSKGNVRFYVYASEVGEYAITGNLSAETSGFTMVQSIGTATFNATAIEINTPEIVNTNSVTVTGTARAYSDITVYADGKAAGTTKANGSGNWAMTFDLKDVASYSYHYIYATIYHPFYNGEITTETKTVIYDERYPTVSNVTMYNRGDNGQNTTVFDFVSGKAPGSYRMWPGVYTSFTFTIEFAGDVSNAENVVLYVLTKSGEIKKFPAKYDRYKELWTVATNFSKFADAPVNVYVDYDCTYSINGWEAIEADIKHYKNKIEETYSSIVASAAEYVSYTETVDENGRVVLTATNMITGEEVWDVIFTNRDYNSVKDEIRGKSLYNGKVEESSCSAYVKAVENGFEYIFVIPDAEAAASITIDYSKFLASNEYSGGSLTEVFAGNNQIIPFINNLVTSGNIEYLRKMINTTKSINHEDSKTSRKWVDRVNDRGEYVLDDADREQLKGKLDAANNEFNTSSIQAEANILDYTNTVFSTALLTAVLESVFDSDAFIEKTPESYVDMWSALETGSVDGQLQKTLLKDEYSRGLWKNINSLYSSISSNIRMYTLVCDSSYTRNIANYIIGTNDIKNKLKLKVDVKAINEAVNRLGLKHNSVVKDIEREIKNKHEGFTKEGDIVFILPDAIPILDPSGYVYEAVQSNRLEGVTATIYYRGPVLGEYGEPTGETHEIVWDAENYSNQINPIVTGTDGVFHWDVPAGEWKVVFEKAGYDTVDTGWLPVPPIQEDIRVAMVSTVAPEVEAITVYEDNVEIKFTQYMNIASVNTDTVKVTLDGKELTGTITPIDATPVIEPAEDEETEVEVASDETAEEYARTFKFVTKDALTNDVQVAVNGAVNYAGNVMGVAAEETLTAVAEPKSVSVVESVNMEPNTTVLLETQILPLEAGAARNITATSSSPEIVKVINEHSITDENGKVNISIEGSLPGEADVTISVDGTEISTVINVKVAEAVGELPKCENVTSSEIDKELAKGTMITLSTETEGAEIYYTLDGSDPADVENTARIPYTGPIKAEAMYINSEGEKVMHINACATMEGYADAISSFEYDINNTMYRVVLQGVKDTSRVLVGAAYNDDGELIGYTVLKPSEADYNIIDVEAEEEISYVKIMNWDSLAGMQPEAVEADGVVIEGIEAEIFD